MSQFLLIFHILKITLFHNTSSTRKVKLHSVPGLILFTDFWLIKLWELKANRVTCALCMEQETFYNSGIVSISYTRSNSQCIAPQYRTIPFLLPTEPFQWKQVFHLSKMQTNNPWGKNSNRKRSPEERNPFQAIRETWK